MKGSHGICLLVLVLAWGDPTAHAHLGLTEPTSRYGADVLKDGPCGRTGGARSERVTRLEPGAELDLVWDEYIDHPGHFRVSFDADGDDDFVDPRCLAGCESTTPEIELYSNEHVLVDGIDDTPSGGQTRMTITLPDVECERCTLQVIQVMYDKPPYTLPGNDIYYQCADLVLRRADAEARDGGAAALPADAGTADAGTGRPPTAAADAAPSAPSEGADGGPRGADGGPRGIEGSCRAGTGISLPPAAMAALLLALLLRRRRGPLLAYAEEHDAADGEE